MLILLLLLFSSTFLSLSTFYPFYLKSFQFLSSRNEYSTFCLHRERDERREEISHSLRYTNKTYLIRWFHSLNYSTNSLKSFNIFWRFILQQCCERIANEFLHCVCISIHIMAYAFQRLQLQLLNVSPRIEMVCVCIGKADGLVVHSLHHQLNKF